AAGEGDGGCSKGVGGVDGKGGFADCDGDKTNGCETNVDGSPDHCGSCDVTCSPHHACSFGACSVQCLPGFSDCDGDAANGCEVMLATNALNCRRCRHHCLAAPR